MDGQLLLYAVIAMFLLFLIPFVFFLYQQQRLLQLVKPENRSLPPGQVWLQLIPLFGIVWQFIVVSRISDSLRKELSVQDPSSIFTGIEESTERPAYKRGILYCILAACAYIPIPFINSIIGLAAIVTWILYWIELYNYSKKLGTVPATV